MFSAAPSSAQLLFQWAHLQCGAGQGARALEIAFLLWSRLLKENSLDILGRGKKEADYSSLKLNCFVVWEWCFNQRAILNRRRVPRVVPSPSPCSRLISHVYCDSIKTEIYFCISHIAFVPHLLCKAQRSSCLRYSCSVGVSAQPCWWWPPLPAIDWSIPFLPSPQLLTSTRLEHTWAKAVAFAACLLLDYI